MTSNDAGPFMLPQAGGAIDLLPESRQPNRLRKRLTRRSRVSTATIFRPMNPSETPEQHFPLQTVSHRASQPRFVNRYDSHEILIVVDGSCINNGSVSQTSMGGCSFAYKGIGKSGLAASFPFSVVGQSEAGTVGFPLEQTGPGGEHHAASSNRAKLRAVIAGLAFREWQEEGWKRIVIATDLEYVALGATRWLTSWVRRRWKTRKARNVANRDLWEELHGLIQKLACLGTEVSFWLISSRDAIKQASTLMQDTKGVAREAAVMHFDSSPEEFTRLCGIEV
ncbi:putative RNase h domain protein [Rosellinia necatrix]|uniref:Putative RNase h domain protein n=1 Tax=Rosellinia necatrix TaxID=77044 RepID=A0A1W2TRY1_ROSNE|nr:putative RNase h domain protein [Rosellinia necatrix]